MNIALGSCIASQQGKATCKTDSQATQSSYVHIQVKNKL